MRVNSYDHRTVRRRHLLGRAVAVVALFAVGGLGAGCNLQWSPYAAKVGSSEISPATLDGALKAANASNGFRCLLEHSTTGGFRLKGAGTDTYDSAFSAYVLTNLIDENVARALVHRRRLLEPPSAHLLAAEQVSAAFSSELSSSGCGTAAPSSILSSLGSTLAASFVSLQLDEDALAARAAGVTLTPGALVAYERSHPASTRDSCLSGIFVKSDAIARKVKRRLVAGASFVALVDRYSPTQAATRGVLGCYGGAQLTSISPAISAAVAAAAVRAPIGPIPYRGSFLVLVVTRRPFEPAVDVLNVLFAAHSAAFSLAITRAVRASHVAVNPQYGRWSQGTSATTSLAGFGGRVVPLRGPHTAYVLNESAVRARASSALASRAGTGS